MIRPLTIVLVFLTLSAALPAQSPVRRQQVPPTVQEDFSHRHADAENIQWLQEGEQYFGARFTVAEQAGEAVYLPSGQWVQSREAIAYKQLPDAARRTCREKYPDFYAHQVDKLSTRNYGVLYKIKVRKELTQATLTFDMHGKLRETQEEQLEPEKKGLKGKLGKMFGK
ncbi:MAG: PepSY-like domain-containing protein [Bacteroidota bacterium]